MGRGVGQEDEVESVLDASGVWWSSIFLRRIGVFLLLMAVAWNIFILVDAINFDVGEHWTPACRTFQEIVGFNFAIFAFLAQAMIFVVLNWLLRSWLFAVLAVFPYWGFFFAQFCTGGT